MNKKRLVEKVTSKKKRKKKEKTKTTRGYRDATATAICLVDTDH